MTTLAPYHWDRFCLQMYYQTSVEKLFETWATPKGLSATKVGMTR